MRVLAAAISAAVAAHLVATIASAAEEGTPGPTKLSLALRYETAIGVHDPVLQKAEITLQPTLETSLPGGFSLTMIARLRADPADELQPGSPTQDEVWHPSRSLQIGSVTDLALRELYVYRRYGRLALTLGKQQVVWGTADGLKVLDVVDPQDYREFILDDFSDSRLPLWTANVEIDLTGLQLQLLWIPDRSYHEIPRDGALYAFTSPELVPPRPAAPPTVVEGARRPERFFADSDAGLRLSGRAAGWDLSLNYLYAYDDAPVLVRSTEFGDDGLVTTIRPEYRRTHYVGGSFATARGALVVRGEAAYASDFYLYSTNLVDADGVAGGWRLSYVFGVDWFAPLDLLASVQMFQQYTGTNASQTPQEGWTTIPTLLLRKAFAGDRAVAQTFWLHDVDRGDGLIRASLRYDLRDDLAVATGFDVFYGDDDGIFGEFDDNDHVVFEVEYKR